MRTQLIFTILLVAACSAPDGSSSDEPGPIAEGVPLADVNRRLAPLVLGSEVHRASPDAEIGKHMLYLDGIPVTNVRFRTRRLSDGKTIGLDELRPAADLETSTTARLREDDVAEIARMRHPLLPLDAITPEYEAEMDGDTIRSLARRWKVTMRATTTAAPRQLTIDDATALVVYDTVAAYPVAVQGIGSYFKDVTLEATEDLDLKQTCLRDPGYPWEAFRACEEISIEAKVNFGVATYFMNPVDASLYVPVAVTGGSIGDGDPPDSDTDAAGLDTQAVDAHVGALRAIQFYRDMFGRTFIGSKGDSLIVVVDPSLRDTSRGEATWSIIRSGLRTNALAEGKAHPDIMMHEYTHLLMHSEGIEYSSRETAALHEGIADIFGILMQPTLDAGGYFAITAPAEPWRFPSEASAMVGGQRLFARPSDDHKSVDAYGDRSPDDQLSFEEVLGNAHNAGGPVRRWFYFLAKGANPYDPNGDNEQGSRFLPGGMHGLGVDTAARILYRTITDAKFPDITPSYRELRDGMLGMISAQEQCSVSYKAVRDAWAAVNVGPAVDRIRPMVTGTATQLEGGEVRVAVHASDHGDGLSPSPSARILVNDVQVGSVPLQQTSSSSPFTYSGAVNLPLGVFTAFGFGPMTVTFRLGDFCGNQADPWNISLVLDHTGPAVLEFRDRTSTYAWVTNPDGSLRTSPFALSTPVRTLRVATNDSARIRQLALQTPQQQAVWTTNDTAVEGDFPINLDGSLTGAPLTLTVTDRYDNTTTRNLSPFVDRVSPECMVSCTQPTNWDSFACSVRARDEHSGVFAVRLRTVEPSPALVPLGGPHALRQHGATSLVADDWHWFYADLAQWNGAQLVRRGPGETFETTLRTSSEFAPDAPRPLPSGAYQLKLECRDFWGNTREALVSSTLSRRPTLSVTQGPIDNSGNYAFVVRATHPDTVTRFEVTTWKAWPNQDFGAPISSSIPHECGSPGNRPTTCEKTVPGVGQPGQKIRVWVVAYDVHGASTGTSLEMMLPMPPPPPPPANVFTEQEINCGSFVNGYHGQHNLVPANAVEIVGRFDDDSTIGYGCYGDSFLIPFTSGTLAFDMDHDYLCNVYTENGSDACVRLMLQRTDVGLDVKSSFPSDALRHSDAPHMSYVLVHVQSAWPHQSGQQYRIRIVR